jgi:hypothetical protein
LLIELDGDQFCYASYAFSSRSKPFLLGSRLSNPKGTRQVLLGLVVMPSTELVLPFDVDGHQITPTTPTQDPPMLPPF